MMVESEGHGDYVADLVEMSSTGDEGYDVTNFIC